MENIRNFNEDKLKNKKLRTFLSITILIIAIAVIFVLCFCNFTDKYGIIPAEEKISSGDKLLYVMLLEGFPKDIEYNKETSEICLSYNKTIYDTQADVTVFFGKGCRLDGLVYTFNEVSETDKNEFSKKMINNIDNELDERFSFEASNQNDKSTWKYSEGARSENIEFYFAENNAYIVTDFQF